MKPASGPPDFNTSQIWLADFTPDLATLNSDQQFFTRIPGGFAIFSWQTGDDACRQSHDDRCDGYAYSTSPGFDCAVTFQEAEAVAPHTDPPIPRFDKWTNTNPENECLAPPRQF